MVGHIQKLNSNYKDLKNIAVNLKSKDISILLKYHFIKK